MAFGDTWQLGTSGTPINLPEPTEFSEDDVRQGGIHILLNGKRREDKFSNVKHFRLAWAGLTETEVGIIESAITRSGTQVFTYWRGSYNVVIGNSEPVQWSVTGYASIALELEETL